MADVSALRTSARSRFGVDRAARARRADRDVLGLEADLGVLRRIADGGAHADRRGARRRPASSGPSASTRASTSPPVIARQVRARTPPSRLRWTASSTIASTSAAMCASRAVSRNGRPAERTTSGLLQRLDEALLQRGARLACGSSRRRRPDRRGRPWRSRSSRLASHANMPAIDGDQRDGGDGEEDDELAGHCLPWSVRGLLRRGEVSGEYASRRAMSDELQGCCRVIAAPWRRGRSSGSSWAASPRQSAAQMTSSSSHSSRFHGWAIVADEDAVLDRAGEVLGAVVDQQVDAELDAAADLVVRAVQVVVGAGRSAPASVRWRRRPRGRGGW